MIDKELRSAAFWVNLMVQPKPWSFKLMATVSKMGHSKQLDGFSSQEIQIPRTNGSSIRTRIFGSQQKSEKLPVLLFLHGGGYVFGAPEAFLPMINDFLEASPCVIVAPDYRKSLDAPYPAAIDDAYDTLLWIRNNADSLGVRDDQIMVGGPSAGGGLTAAVTLRARERGDVKIAFQMPLYPMLDDCMQTESARDSNAPVWSSKHNALGWKYYLRDLNECGASIPQEAAPARATNYSDLPPALTYIGDIEVFRDETIAYVRNLQNAGVPVQFEVFDGCFHGFDVVSPNSSAGKRARRFMLEGFKRAIDNYFAPQDPQTK